MHTQETTIVWKINETAKSLTLNTQFLSTQIESILENRKARISKSKTLFKIYFDCDTLSNHFEKASVLKFLSIKALQKFPN